MSEDLEDIKVDLQSRSILPSKEITLRPRASKHGTRPISSSSSSSASSASTVDASTTDPLSQNLHLPGLASIYLKTFGCAHNISDSEYMLGLLSTYGYNIVSHPSDADCYVINSCTVKDPSQAAFINVVREAQSKNIPVVVCGCVPQADRKVKGLENVSTIGVMQIDKIVDAVTESLQGNTVRYLSLRSGLPSLHLPKIRRNPYIEIIPLSTGCLGNCTYCKTKHARGTLGSYPISEILKRAQSAIKEGVMEIWLSSEDTGAYGIDINTSLSTLLQRLTREVVTVETGVMLRIGMTNPPYILDQLSSVSKIMNLPQVFSFLHVPVQSGSDNVLVGEGGMNREYTRRDFEKVCDELIKSVPDITIATDIICGFPNEKEDDFKQTMSLMEKYRFHICNISQFYPRPGTVAARMKRIDTKIVKGRSREFSTLFNSFKPYKKYVSTTQTVFFGLESDNTKTMSVGHLKNYTKVLVPIDLELRGCKAEVEIEKGERFHISGKVVPNSVVRLVALPKEDSEEKKETETEENCDEQNYKVVESCVGDGCGETGCSSKGEEKKEECCGTGDCQSVEKVEEEKVDTSDTSSFTDVKFMVAVTLPAVAGLSLVIYAIVKSLKRR
ncbi:hypothetical protein TrVE_jg13827 [Triparma verrucosa]|uniref:Threonylcarbamoyladenosine tRNA methylthiotransferase n=1 Tax=Triparma verrucosa TaxID=1606542 RepID=A0A9W7FKG1_9STRA|nr:hypothetical protein TrVE_jg13827 [Triparma verrucosa]